MHLSYRAMLTHYNEQSSTSKHALGSCVIESIFMRYRLLSSQVGWLRDGDNATLLRGGLRGLEKESLRVDHKGILSHCPHPESLGSALTHPHLTTDYSEAMMEFVTPAYPSNWETLQFLCDLHSFVADNLEDELLWAQSMPCLMPQDCEIPIADYGTSNLGRMKSVYRNGLGFRYGRTMQAISGVHFNYSLPIAFWEPYREQQQGRQNLNEFISEQYMALIRGYRRYAWLLIYLFGASPAFCKSFSTERHPVLEELDSQTWYAPYGTSLRMSDIGYRNKSQAALQISANSLDGYVSDLAAAVTTPNSQYGAIGVLVDGEYRQLNSNTLQIENEYYSPIRPKSRADNLDRPTLALKEFGVEYVEVRTLDLNMMDPVGINQNQLRFVEALLIYCLLVESPPIDAREQAEIDARDLLVAREGRQPGLKLPRNGRKVTLTDWALEILETVREIAVVLDVGDEGYASATDAQVAAVLESELTPSARILNHMRTAGASFLEFTLESSRAHAKYFSNLKLTPEKQNMLCQFAVESLQEQRRLEEHPQQPFDAYLKDYFERG